MARASSEMALASSWTRSGSHVAAAAIETGNIVVGRSQTTPCRHWFHLSDLMLNFSRSAQHDSSNCAFSSRVRREIKSWTRSSIDCVGSR